jgi:hypothetical protein
MNITRALATYPSEYHAPELKSPLGDENFSLSVANPTNTPSTKTSPSAVVARRCVNRACLRLGSNFPSLSAPVVCEVAY